MRTRILSLILICTFNLTNAQEANVKEKKGEGNAIPTFIRFDNTETQYKKGEEEKIWKEFLKTTSSDKLEKIKGRIDQGQRMIIFENQILHWFIHRLSTGCIA